MSAPTYFRTRRARKAVGRFALDRSDEHHLLDVLGLITEDGELVPDDNSVYTFPAPDKGPGAKNPDATNAIPQRPRDRSAVPLGLVNLPPEPVQEPAKKRRGPKPQPKVIRPSRVREVPECGSYKAFSRHRRLGEEIDDACAEASRAYGRAKSAERRKKQKEAN